MLYEREPDSKSQLAAWLWIAIADMRMARAVLIRSNRRKDDFCIRFVFCLGFLMLFPKISVSEADGSKMNERFCIMNVWCFSSSIETG